MPFSQPVLCPCYWKLLFHIQEDVKYIYNWVGSSRRQLAGSQLMESSRVSLSCFLRVFSWPNHDVSCKLILHPSKRRFFDKELVLTILRRMDRTMSNVTDWIHSSSQVPALPCRHHHQPSLAILCHRLSLHHAITCRVHYSVCEAMYS
jgi:hypothetical protein